MTIFKHQFWHFVILIMLLAGIYGYTISHPELLKGNFLGINTKIWFAIALTSPILHQIYVLLCWRLELLHQSISKTFGSKGFSYYKFGFTLLIISRLASIICLAISNKHSFNLSPFLSVLFSIALSIPAIYLFYSVKRYFGINRAFGIDHFKPEAFKNLKFIKKGIYKYTSNGMYIFGFLILYVPGVIFQSKAAMLLAIFNHIYIWVHNYCTELPDIKLIYNNPKKNE